MRRLSAAEAMMVACALSGCQQDSPRHLPAGPQVSADQVAPTDPEINPNDTYVVFDADMSSQATITLPEPVPDPPSGQDVTSLTFVDTVATRYHVEAGYDQSGVLRVTLTGTWPTNIDSLAYPVPDAYRLVLSNGQLYEYAVNGSPLPAPPSSGLPSAMEPLLQLGADLYYGDITAGVVSDSLPPPVPPQSAQSGPAGLLRVALSGDVTPGPVDATRGARGQGATRRTHRQQHGKWVLEEVTHDDDAVLTRGTRLHSTTRLSLRNVRWNNNAGRDQWRRDRRAAGYAMVPPIALADVAPCEAEVCQPDSEPPPPPPTPPTGRNVVFLHGLGDTPARWTRMRDWLRPTYLFGTERGPQLTAGARPGQQANELISYLQTTGDTGFLAVSHSMGGLVARQVAQHRPDLVSGVLTVGTPHLGALAALRAKPAVRVAFNGLADFIYSFCAPQGSGLHCFIGDVIVRSLGDYLANYVVPSGPAADLQPVQYVANPYVQGLNATTESFPRVGIVTFTAQRWVWARLLAESGGLAPDDPDGGGRVWVRRVSRTYFTLQMCHAIAVMAFRTDVANGCASLWKGFDIVDFLWGWVTTYGPGGFWSDGLVQTSSQFYPNATENFDVRVGDSHAGEPRSDKTRDALLSNRVLERVFSVPRP